MPHSQPESRCWSPQQVTSTAQLGHSSNDLNDVLMSGRIKECECGKKIEQACSPTALWYN